MIFMFKKNETLSWKMCGPLQNLYDAEIHNLSQEELRQVGEWGLPKGENDRLLIKIENGKLEWKLVELEWKLVELSEET